MRDQLLLNPRKFKTNGDVLGHLREILPSWSAKNVSSVGAPELTIKFNKIRSSQERHDYELQLDVTNNTRTRIEDFQVDLLFPDAFLNQTIEYGPEVHARRTRTHRLFRASSRNGLLPIAPGDTLKVLTVPYYVDQSIFLWHKSGFDDKLTATLYSYVPEREPQVVEKTMKELHSF